MSTETTQTPETNATPAPSGDALPPELQYLKDAGEDISEFLPTPDGGAQPAQNPAEGAPDAPQKATDGGDEPEPGEITLGKDGRPHDPKTGRYIPLKALHEERERRKAAEAELAKHREQSARLDERLKLVQQPAKTDDKGQAPANPWDEQDIDPTQDLVGAINQQRRRERYNYDQHTAATRQTRETLTEQGIQQTYRSDVQRVAGQRADYAEAYKHLIVSRAKELIALGQTDQKALAETLAAEEADIVRHAVTAGRSPAESLYALAVARGYAPAAGQQPQTQTNGSAPAAPAAPAAKTPAQQQIEAINAGQEAGKTLSGAGAGAPVGLTLEQFLSMDPDDILKMRSTPQGRAQLQAIGAL